MLNSRENRTKHEEIHEETLYGGNKDIGLNVYTCMLRNHGNIQIFEELSWYQHVTINPVMQSYLQPQMQAKPHGILK